MRRTNPNDNSESARVKRDILAENDASDSELDEDAAKFNFKDLLAHWDFDDVSADRESLDQKLRDQQPPDEESEDEESPDEESSDEDSLDEESPE